jgi:hypothetical protein
MPSMPCWILKNIGTMVGGKYRESLRDAKIVISGTRSGSSFTVFGSIFTAKTIVIVDSVDSLETYGLTFGG